MNQPPMTAEPPMSTVTAPRQVTAPPRTPHRHPHRRRRRLMAVALVATALGLAACGSSGTATTTTSSGGGSAGKTATTTHSIVIRNFAFSPSTATVAAGSTVTVINEDQVAHTLTATKGGFTTGDIAAGTSKTFTAPKTPGTYTYICSIHQYMTGSLVVSG